jgi:hypothetical protein
MLPTITGQPRRSRDALRAAFPTCITYRTHSVADFAYLAEFFLQHNKGRGDRTAPSSYRPISICSSLGKILERVVNKQLRSHLHVCGYLHPSQHGFVEGKSVVTNHLACDHYIADCLATDCAYDIVTFDFQKAFDKAPHQYVIDAAAACDLGCKALQWLCSFLSNRSQQVKVGNCYSTACNVISGVVQGSVLGPVLYVMLTDALLRDIKLPAMAFADDLKIVASSTSYSQQDVQNAIDTIATWAVDHHMPLAVDKCAVMHCGKQQTYRQYILKGQPMAVVTSLTDLGIVRSPGFTSTEQCAAVASTVACLPGLRTA